MLKLSLQPSKATPTALPYPILRRLSSTSHSRVAPRARMAAGGGGRPGGQGEKGRLDFLYVETGIIASVSASILSATAPLVAIY